MIVFGRVLGTYGVAGWIKVESFCERTDALLSYPVWWLRAPGEALWRGVKCTAGRLHSDTLVAHLAGLDDREGAAAVKGNEIGVPRSMLPPTQGDEIYWTDLVGLTVVNRDPRVLGTVTAVTAHGAHPLLQVRAPEGSGPDRLIPFVPAVVDAVDVAGGRIEVDWGEDF